MLDYIFLILIFSISYYTNKKFIVIFIGILYDLLFSNILFLYLIISYIMFLSISFIKNKFNKSYCIYIILLLTGIIFLIICKIRNLKHYKWRGGKVL